MMRSNNEYIAYKGEKFTIEWYVDEKGESQAREYAEELSDSHKKKLAVLLMAMGNIGEIRNKQKFRNEGDKIYAFKPKPHRFLSFFFSGRKIIITNAFYKDQDKLPKQKKNRALRMMQDYERRVKEEHIMTRNTKSTLDRWIEQPSFKNAVDKEYKDFLLSELILALMENDSKSVRELAKAVDLTPLQVLTFQFKSV